MRRSIPLVICVVARAGSMCSGVLAAAILVCLALPASSLAATIAVSVSPNKISHGGANVVVTGIADAVGTNGVTTEEAVSVYALPSNLGTCAELESGEAEYSSEEIIDQLVPGGPYDITGSVTWDGLAFGANFLCAYIGTNHYKSPASSASTVITAVSAPPVRPPKQKNHKPSPPPTLTQRARQALEGELSHYEDMATTAISCDRLTASRVKCNFSEAYTDFDSIHICGNPYSGYAFIAFYKYGTDVAVHFNLRICEDGQQQRFPERSSRG
jgi:hypothetical protein